MKLWTWLIKLNTYYNLNLNNMFLKVKRLQAFENLILETDLIQIGNEAESILNKETSGESSGESTDTSSDQEDKDQGQTGSKREATSEDIDRLLDMLFNLGEDDLNERIGDPAFKKIFSDPRMKVVFDRYFAYLNERVEVYRKELADALNKPEINSAEIDRITERLTKIVCRVRVVEIVYEKMSAEKAADFSDEITQKVKEVNQAILEAVSLRLSKSAERTQSAYSKFQGAQTEEEKVEAATEVFSTLHSAEELAQEMPDAEAGIKDAADTYTKRMASELGEARVEDIKAGIYVNKNVTVIIRRIFEFQYTNWTNEQDILTEANKLRTSINGFPDVSTEAKEYLTRLVDQIQVQLIDRAKNKAFSTPKFKGIHYDFNKKLPLYERTALPVTGKQIADDSKIMKLRKALGSLISIFASQTETTKAGEAFKQTSKWLHDIYAHTLNTSAKFIGKKIKGREGEMKADAFTRMFIPDPSVVDKPKSAQVSEDAVAPGQAIQSPGSIGGMGSIIPPTETSIGSGDNFGMPKKKKKSGVVLDFSGFLKEQNKKY